MGSYGDSPHEFPMNSRGIFLGDYPRENLFIMDRPRQFHATLGTVPKFPKVFGDSPLWSSPVVPMRFSSAPAGFSGDRPSVSWGLSPVVLRRQNDGISG